MNGRRADTFLKTRILNNGILFEYYALKELYQIQNPIKKEVVDILDGFFQKINIYLKQLNKYLFKSKTIGNYEIELRDHVDINIKVIRIIHKYINLSWVIHNDNNELRHIAYDGPIDEITNIVEMIINAK